MKKLISMLLVIVLVYASFGVVLAETLKGSAAGINGTITVAVTTDNGVITGVEILEHSETPGISDPAIAKLPEAIVAANSADIDGISGATMTSNGIKNAVNNALAGLGADEGAEVVVPFEKTDVIVIGAGMGGLSAAVRAAELGANVVLIEQESVVGGCARYSGGSLVGVNTLQQKELGLVDSSELLIEDFTRLGGEGNFNMDLAMKFAETCGVAVDWLDTFVGVDFGERTPTTGGYIALNVPRVHYATPENGDVSKASASGGSGYVKGLSNKYNEFIQAGNACLLLNTRATEVIQENGVITGVRAETPFGERVYSAPSVILATGGYGGNEAWLKRDFSNIYTTSPECVSGDGYTFAEQLGAGFAGMDWLSTSIGCIPNGTFRRTFQINAFNWFYPLWVTTDGDRFLNEPASTSASRCEASIVIPENLTFLVFNEEMLAQTDMLFYLSPDDDATTLQKMLDEGISAFKTDSIEELAEKFGMANLAKTVENYNAACKGEAQDVMGRTENMIPLTEGPFYVVKTIPYISKTGGGPKSSVNAELLREDDTVIPGVFLCGEIVGSNNITGHSSIGGSAHGLCVTWGMIAAESAVAFAGK